MSQCTFYLSDGVCKVLKTQKCKHCRFEKTHEEFQDGLRRAADILEQKGLEKHEVNENGVKYVRVRRKEK